LVERPVAVAQPAQRIVVLEILEAVVARREHGLAALLAIARDAAATRGGDPDAGEIRFAVGRAWRGRLGGGLGWRLRQARGAIEQAAEDHAAHESAEAELGKMPCHCLLPFDVARQSRRISRDDSTIRGGARRARAGYAPWAPSTISEFVLECSVTPGSC